MNQQLLLDQARNPAYWHELNPEFNIGRRSLLGHEQIDIDSAMIASAKERLRVDGYFQIAPLLNDSLVDALALGVRNIRQSGWPTPFAVVYDEYWEMFYSLGQLFNAILGSNYKQLPNFWCWYIDTNYASKGWAHHRDRPSVKSVRQSDGLPETLTVWIPLTDATVLNGCIYLVPARFDANYPDNLESVDIGDPQNIRALPANKGSVLAWSESILHWGSRSSDRANCPRISISFTYQRDDVNPYEIPLFDTNKLPSFEERLGLIAQNVVKYQGHANSTTEIIAVCDKLSNLIPAIEVTDAFKHEILDSDKRLSETQLWTIQENYFTQENFHAWQVVPFYCTSRAPFCDLYADMAIALLLDLVDTLDREAPLYFLELGGGTGCFAYRFLNKLLERRERFAKLSHLKIRYVLTDFTSANVNQYMNLKRLKGLVESDILDFAVFRPDRDETIKLMRSGQTLSAQTLKNPVIAIANYFFDSIKHDAFRIANGQMEEVRFTISRNSRVCDLSAPVRIDNLHMIERYFDCPPDYYGNKAVDSVLEYYRENLEEASIIFPIGAMQAITNLLRLSSDQLILLAVDKGFTTLNSNQIMGLRKQQFSAHGSFSFQVNFDAIHRFVAALGGKSYMEAGDHFSLCTNVNILLKNQEIRFDHFTDVFSESIIKKDLANSLYNLEEVIHKSSLNEPYERPKIALCLSIVQAYSFEPFVFSMVFNKMFDSLQSELSQIDAQQKEELLIAFRQVWKNIYMTSQDLDALDCLFRFYVELGQFDDCLQLCAESLETFGSLGTILDHFALCYESQGKFELAYQYFHQSVEQNPDHEWAREGLARTRHLLGKDETAQELLSRLNEV